MRYFFVLFVLLVVSCNEKKIKDIDSEPSSNFKSVDLDKQILEPIYSGCGYNYKLSESDIIFYPPAPREIDQIKSLLSYTGIPMNFDIFSADINNAAAIFYDNKRYIVYDRKFFYNVDRLSNSYWSSMSILAHEIGHHLSGHTLILNSGGKDSHKTELEADKFSGFLLFKMGATIEESCLAIDIFGTLYDTESHPSKIRRIQAIKEGWGEALKASYESAVPPSPTDENGNNQFTWQEEFFMEDLIFPEAISAPNFGDYIRSMPRPTIEGIIIKVDKSDPSGGGYAETFDREPSIFNYELTVQITNGTGNVNFDDRPIGSREKFYILEYASEMSLYSIKSLEALIVPGRKIQFQPFFFGYGAEQMIYIKRMDR